MSNRIVENYIDEYYYDDITKDKIIEKRPDLSYIFNIDMEYDSDVLSFICDCDKKPEKINTDKFKTISRNVALKFMIDTGRLHLDDYNVYDGKTPIESDERFKPLELLLREEIGFCAFKSSNTKVRKHLIGHWHTIDMNDFENDNEFSNFTRKIIEESFAIVPYEHLRVGQIFKYLGPYQIPRFFPDWDRKCNRHVLYSEYMSPYIPSSCYEDYVLVPCCFAGYI